MVNACLSTLWSTTLFWVIDIVIFFKLITKYWTFVLVCPWKRFVFCFSRNVGKKMELMRLARLTFYMKVSNQQNRFQNNVGYKQVASFCGNIGTKSPKVQFSCFIHLEGLTSDHTSQRPSIIGDRLPIMNNLTFLLWLQS